MIKKTLVSFFIIFVTYTFIITYLVDPNKFSSEHQWQDNQIIAQKYILSNTDSIENIIVGSSLAFRMSTEHLPNTYNLSFGGLSIFDGLNTINKKAIYPKKIFIEMNMLDRKPSIDFTTSLNNPVMNLLRYYFPSVRDGKQPVGMMAIPYGEKVAGYSLYISQTILHSTARKLIKKEPLQINMFQKQLSLIIGRNSQQPNKAELEQHITNLKDLVLILEEKNVNIVFFEMPIEPDLCDLSKPKAIRSIFYETFPRDKYQYIDIPDCKDYKTTDGMHLNKMYAEKYTSYFKETMDKLK